MQPGVDQTGRLEYSKFGHAWQPYGHGSFRMHIVNSTASRAKTLVIKVHKLELESIAFAETSSMRGSLVSTRSYVRGFEFECSTTSGTSQQCL